jgi:16S rRNA (guanine527-N7)-methyltransferase
MSDAPPPDMDTFDAEAFRAATSASPMALTDLDRFRRMIATWNTRINLVGPSALDGFWRRHALDSAQLLDFAPSAHVWADLGAGAGFPGVVLAILLKGRAGAQVHLVESMVKRCGFLHEVVAALELPAVVHNIRAEVATIPDVEVVTARACAPLDRLLGFAWPFLGDQPPDGTIGLFLKGENADRELTEARRSWDFKVQIESSRSDPTGRILRIERLRRVR